MKPRPSFRRALGVLFAATALLASTPSIAAPSRRQAAEAEILEETKVLAETYQGGDLPLALKRAEALQAKMENVLGPEDSVISVVLSIQAEIHRATGDLPRAKALVARALTLAENGPSERRDQLMLPPLMMLAAIYSQEGEYDKAEATAVRAIALFEKWDKTHPKLATLHTTLGEIKRSKGDLAGAEAEFALAAKLGAAWDGTRPGADERLERALRASAAADRMSLENNKALVAWDRGRIDEARALMTKAVEMGTRDVPTSMNLALSLLSLAELEENMDDLPAALTHLRASQEILEKNLSIILASGSEAQKAAFLTQIDRYTDVCLSLVTFRMPRNPEAIELGLRAALIRKGRVLDTMVNSFSSLRRHATPEVAGLLEKIAAARRTMAAEMSAGMVSGEDATRSELERLERLVADQSASFKADERPVDAASVRAAVAADSALIEIVRFRTRYSKADADSPRYGAIIIAHGAAPVFADLGDAESLDDLVSAYRRALVKPEGSSREEGVAVRERAFDPLVSALGSASHVLVATDGALHLLPFASLPDAEGGPLVRRYAFSYLTSGRDLLRFDKLVPLRGKPVIVAAPDFDAELASAKSGPSLLPNATFSALPGTAAEADTLRTILDAERVLIGADASEEAIRKIAGPSILHIATHGFFRAGPPAPVSHDRGLVIEAARQTTKLPENPLLRAGLVFAGANRHAASPNDGILTALEATDLDLWGTRLVTLSACETGVGEGDTHDGVFGLRRALLIAGSQSQLTSLWPVDDQATVTLMRAFYSRLKAGEMRSEALQHAQQEIASTPGTEAPYYWAAFVLSGDPRSFDGVDHTSSGVAPVDPSARGCACEVVAPSTLGEGCVGASLTLLAGALWLARSRRTNVDRCER